MIAIINLLCLSFPSKKVYFNIYGASVLEMCALMCRNISALVCLFLISSSKQKSSRTLVIRLLLEQKTVKFLVTVIILFSMALYSYQLFQYRIVHVLDHENPNNYTNLSSVSSQRNEWAKWDIYQTDFGNSEHKARFEIAATILRDCVNLLILVILNALIIYKLKVNLKRKKRIIKLGQAHETMTVDGLTNMGGGLKRVTVVSTATPPGVMCAGGTSGSSGNLNSTAEGAIRAIKRKENRQTVMVLLTCLNYLIGRIPLLYLFIKRNLFTDYSNFGIYAILIAYVSYTANFVFYYASNHRFRNLINLQLKKAFSFCGRK